MAGTRGRRARAGPDRPAGARRRPAPGDRRVPQPRRRSREPDPGRGRPRGALHRRPARLRLPAHRRRTDRGRRRGHLRRGEPPHRTRFAAGVRAAARHPYALATILDLGARALELDDRALGDPVDTGEPGPDVTALEIVDSLVFSPGPDDRFVADLGPTSRRSSPSSARPAPSPQATRRHICGSGRAPAIPR